MGAAAGHGGAACQTHQAQCGTDGGGADGQGQNDAHNGGNQNAHQEGLLVGGPHNDVAQPAGSGADGRRDQCCHKHAAQNGDGGSDDEVDRGALGNQLAQEHRHQGDDEHGQRAARAAQRVGGIANRQAGIDDKGRRFHRIGDRARHRRALHSHSEVAGVHQQGKLLTPQGIVQVKEVYADCLENRTNQQRGEEAVSHAAQAVDKDALHGKGDILLRAVLFKTG